MRRHCPTHRIVLDLDEPSRRVRATDFATTFDWSAGGSGAALNWKFVTGAVFFQYEHQRVSGFQLDEHGDFKAALSYSCAFNLQETTAPLTAAATQSALDLATDRKEGAELAQRVDGIEMLFPAAPSFGCPKTPSGLSSHCNAVGLRRPQRVKY